jgi:hypothetical protein
MGFDNRRKGRSSREKGRTKMAYALIHHFPGGTKEQYEASIAAVHPSRQSLPKGQIYHVAGPSGGGWTILAVFDSKESWERFRDGILMPKMKAGIAGGFPTPPQETTLEVYNLQK